MLFLRDSGSEFQTVGLKTEKDLLPKVSREKRRTVSNEVSRERNVLEGQYGSRRSEYKVAYCSDRYTENRYKKLFTESYPSLETSGVF